MFFQHLALTHFRNHRAQAWDFSPTLNALYGPNGRGKTNVLEALHYLAMARGFRTDKDAVQQGEAFFLVEGTLYTQGQMATVQLGYAEGKGKKIIVNGRPLPRLSDHIGQVPLVAVLPEDVQLIREGSSLRRRWLDMLLCQADHEYLTALIHYERALEQRNALLALIAARKYPFDTSEITAWNPPLFEHGPMLSERRRSFLNAFAPVFTSYFQRIVQTEEAPTLSYLTQVEENGLADWQRLMHLALIEDRRAGRSTFGIQRDDIGFKIDGRPVKQFASQGQQKTFVVALKMAQHAFLHQRTGKAPILLLDDVFDKLDATRAAHILELLSTALPGQKFITDTSEARLRAELAPAGDEVAFVGL